MIMMMNVRVAVVNLLPFKVVGTSDLPPLVIEFLYDIRHVNLIAISPLPVKVDPFHNFTVIAWPFKL